MYQKVAMRMVYNLIARAILLSDVIFHEKNINIAKNILFLNGYPSVFIDKFCSKRLNFLFKNNANIDISNTQRIKKSPSVWQRHLGSIQIQRVHSSSKSIETF